MKFRKLLTLLSLTILAAPAAHANVSIRNGNFFIGYTDIIYPGGFEPKIERVYNSKTPFSGMFGPGWGTEYDVFLTVSADASVVVHEYGGGVENRFSPAVVAASDLDNAVDTVFKAAQGSGAIGSASQAKTYKEKLRADATFRNDEWDNFVRTGKLQARQLVQGTKLISNRFSYQSIIKVNDGYIRNYETGKTEKFNNEGKLVRLSDKNNNFIDLSYGKDGKLAKLSDNFNRKIFFSFNNKGLLARIDGENNKKAEYRYNDKGELTNSRDTDGNSYTFGYDSEGLHNLTEIAYTDKTNLKVAYWGNDKFNNVKMIKDRDGSFTEYDYKFDKANDDHLNIIVQMKDANSKLVSKNTYEYFMKHKAGSGEEWVQRLVTNFDGDLTDTTYNEKFGLPLQIRRGNQLTSFKYDDKGHVLEKVTPTEVTHLQYDPNAGKVSRVERFLKSSPKRVAWSNFQYDEKSNLIFAENSEKKKVRIVYDKTGRISSLMDQNKHQISFKYNENSRPIQITDPGVGSINVTYSNSGEIKDVQSPAGRKIAMEVTTSFQSLLEIIRPAGVTLSL